MTPATSSSAPSPNGETDMNDIDIEEGRCTNGHPYTAANTARRSNGTRICRTCKKAASDRYLARIGIGATKGPDGQWVRSRPRTLEDYLDKIVPNEDGCWLWLGGKGGAGYGAITRGRFKQPAHRVFFELLVGPIPDGLQLDHLCCVRACVNPDHLEPVTQGENIRRGYERRRLLNVAS